MRILNPKFQDFYEFDCYKYGEPSPLPEWYRDTYIVSEADKNDDRSIIIDINSNLYKTIKKCFLKNTSTNYDWRGKWYGYRSSKKQRIQIEEQIIGIYPYLYYIPEVGINKKTGKQIIVRNGESIDEYALVPFKASDAKRLLTEKDSFKEILEKYNIDYKNCVFPEQIVYAGQDTSSEWLDARSRNINDSFIIECAEIFDMFNAPIIRFKHTNINRHPRDFIKFKADLNINISKTPFLRYYPNILSERDVYTEIENWVIANQREPEHIPDNNTKILAHGFDLKTSFRNM